MRNLAEEFMVSQNNVLDLRKKANHPLSLEYSEIFDCALVDAKISDGRIAPNFRLNIDAPLYKAAKKGIGCENKELSLNSIIKQLNEFYISFQPKNISEWFGIEMPCNKALTNLPPWAAVLPWRARSPESYQGAIEKATHRENGEAGFKGEIDKGWAHCGPVTREKLIVEANRIYYLINDIKTTGYKRSFEKDGDIVATALVNRRKEWKWMVTSGFHRSAVLSALGYQRVPVRINLVIREDELEFWPQVRDGFYSKDEALFIFQKLFLDDNNR